MILYDAIVLGGTPHAAIAAALLAKRGLRGVWIDQDELGVPQGGLPGDEIVSGEGSPAMQAVHRELGIAELIGREACPALTTVQVVLRDQRLDITRDRSATAEEIARALGPGDARVIADVFGRCDRIDAEASAFLERTGPLPPRGFFARRKFAYALGRHPALSAPAESVTEGASPRLAAIFSALATFTSHGPAPRTALDLSRALSRLLRGIATFDGERASAAGAGPSGAFASGMSLRVSCERIAREAGFEIVRGRAGSVERRRGLFKATLSGGREVSAAFLVDASVEHLSLPAGKRLALQGSLHAVAIEIDANVVPPPMADRVLLLEDDPPLLLRAARLEGDRVRLTAAAPGETPVRERLERTLIPFLADGHPREGPLELLHPYYATSVPTETGIKNLFLASPAVLPAFGVEGAYIAALQAAEKLQRRDRVDLHARAAGQ